MSKEAFDLILQLGEAEVIVSPELSTKEHREALSLMIPAREGTYHATAVKLSSLPIPIAFVGTGPNCKVIADLLTYAWNRLHYDAVKETNDGTYHS